MMTYLLIDADEVVELLEVRFRIDLQNISFTGVDSAPIELKTGIGEKSIHHGNALLQWLLIGGREVPAGNYGWVRQDP